MLRRIATVLSAALVAATISAQSIFDTQNLNPSSPKVPEKMTFAGQTIEFNRSDLHERMDRELLAFSYSHQISLLMLRKGYRLFEQIVPILERNGLHEDLKYLMVIESNCDPKARSTAGACGLWQFMPATAREYGLEVSDEVDERYNIEKETEVACQYLKKSYARFKDWFTVAAAYNGGVNGTAKRLADQRQSSALDLWIPNETSRYMFRLLACKMMFEDPSKFGFMDDPADRYPYYEPKEIVIVNEPIPSLVDFAEAHGVSYMQLKEANLWLRSDKLTNKARKTYKIIIPQNL